MAHHKRRRPPSSRAHCHMCKSWKDQQFKDTLNAQIWQERKARVSEREQRLELVLRLETVPR